MFTMYYILRALEVPDLADKDLDLDLGSSPTLSPVTYTLDLLLFYSTLDSIL